MLIHSVSMIFQCVGVTWRGKICTLCSTGMFSVHIIFKKWQINWFKFANNLADELKCWRAWVNIIKWHILPTNLHKFQVIRVVHHWTNGKFSDFSKYISCWLWILNNIWISPFISFKSSRTHINTSTSRKIQCTRNHLIYGSIQMIGKHCVNVKWASTGAMAKLSQQQVQFLC